MTTLPRNGQQWRDLLAKRRASDLGNPLEPFDKLASEQSDAERKAWRVAGIVVLVVIGIVAWAW